MAVRRERVSWSRWDPKRRRMVKSHPYVWVWTDGDGYERCYDTKAEALAAAADAAPAPHDQEGAADG